MKRKKRFFQFDRPTQTVNRPANREVYHFDSPTLASDSVDLENGIIKGVSVITSGITARGHDLEVDKTTLVQMFECAKAKGKVKTKWNHKSGADSVNGYLKNFSIVGDRLRADWHLMKKHSQYEQALELAVEMPEGIGLSASFAGEPELKNGRKFARCEELISTDLVADPAANPNGLFEAEVDNDFSDMANSTEELLAKIEAQGQAIEDLKAFNQQLVDQINADDDDDEDETDDEEEDDDDAESEDDSEVESEDEGSDAFAGVAGPVGAELKALRRQVYELTALHNQQVMEAEEARSQYAFDVIENKTELLIQELEDLRTENAILLEFQQKVQANGGAALSHSRDPITNLSTNATDYEKRVHELAANGKSRADAIRTAMSEGGGRLYQTHLQAKGIVNHMG